MLTFNEITLADKQWMTELFRMGDNNSEEFNYTFCYIWRHIFCYSAVRINDYVIVRSGREDYPASYLFPAGSGDVKPVIDKLIEHCEEAGEKLVFYCVLAHQKALLETMYPDKFEFIAMRDFFDYTYDAQSLITLSGKKLHSKRNHINRFVQNNPDWTYEEITAANIAEVQLMHEKWSSINSEYEDKTFLQEKCSVKNAIKDFASLDLSGGLIRANGQIIAFSMGDRLNSDSFLVHIEKAYGEIQGAYTIMNQEFAKHNCDGYLYINREDDSGDEGLRKSKLSYKPVYLVEKYAAKMV